MPALSALIVALILADGAGPVRFQASCVQQRPVAQPPASDQAVHEP